MTPVWSISQSKNLFKTESLELLRAHRAVIQEVSREISCSEQPRYSIGGMGSGSGSPALVEDGDGGGESSTRVGGGAGKGCREGGGAASGSVSSKCASLLCSDCHQMLPRTAFDKKRQQYQSTKRKCKECRAAVERVRYAQLGKRLPLKDPCLAVHEPLQLGAPAHLRPAAAAAQIGRGGQVTCAFEEHRVDGEKCTGTMKIITKSSWDFTYVDGAFDMTPWMGKPCCGQHNSYIRSYGTFDLGGLKVPEMAAASAKDARVSWSRRREASEDAADYQAETSDEADLDDDEDLDDDSDTPFRALGLTDKDVLSSMQVHVKWLEERIPWTLPEEEELQQLQQYFLGFKCIQHLGNPIPSTTPIVVSHVQMPAKSQNGNQTPTTLVFRPPKKSASLLGTVSQASDSCVGSMQLAACT